MSKKRVIIIGSGVVGSATGRGLIEKEHKVVFVDTKEKIVNKFKQEGFDAFLPSDVGNISADILMFCVSTPSNGDDSVNLDYIKAATANYGDWLKNMQKENIWPLVVIRSTVPPGTTRKILLPIFEEHSEMKAGKDFGLCMQPEFLRAESGMDDFLHPWVTLIGELDSRSGRILEDLYSDFGGEIIRTSLETAELEKYIHNIFNAAKISFANQIWLITKEMDEDIDPNIVLSIMAKTAEGCWNPKYGTVGGQPYGGSCLPKDVKGCIGFLRKVGIDASLLESIDEINSTMEKLADENIVPNAIKEGLNWRQSPALEKNLRA